MTRVRGLIRPTPGVWATADTARSERRLINWQDQAILLADGSPLGECRLISKTDAGNLIFQFTDREVYKNLPSSAGHYEMAQSIEQLHDLGSMYGDAAEILIREFVQPLQKKITGRKDE
jgi:hypothetical protein